MEKGAYILSDCEGDPQVILMGTGSEVHLLLEAQEKLKEESIHARVVSFPSWEIFDAQSKEYKEKVFRKISASAWLWKPDHRLAGANM